MGYNERLKQERIGMTNVNNEGYTMKIIQYNGTHDILVEFYDKFNSVKRCTWHDFKNGSVNNPNNYIIKRLNEENYNYQGLHMIIVEYREYDDIDVMFDDGYIKEHVHYSEFKNGTIRNHMIKEIYGVGILGDIKTKNNGRITKEYSTWSNMLQRCYDPKRHEEFPRYKGCIVCEEWLYFPNFVKWCHSQNNWNKVMENPSSYHIDKDIINKGNKIYAPYNCSFVPGIVNGLFCKSNAIRGKYPIGVSLTPKTSKFRARCNNPLTKKHIVHYGFSTPEAAFEQYKKDKEMIIKQVAQEEYNKGNIIKSCYEAMMKYEVEITD